MEIRHVLVVGAGLMGSGIAQVSAVAGYRVTMHDVSQGTLDKGMAGIARSMGKLVESGQLKAVEREAASSRVSPTLTLDAASGSDLVIEAVYEDKALKQEVFRELDHLCRPDTILCSNTSAIPITELARVTARPDRVVGTHFFSPVPLMRLCELVCGLETSDETLVATKIFVESLGKETITVKRDVAGFALNRINLPSTIEAIRLVEAGVATTDDIDRVMRVGMGRRNRLGTRPSKRSMKS